MMKGTQSSIVAPLFEPRLNLSSFLQTPLCFIVVVQEDVVLTTTF